MRQWRLHFAPMMEATHKPTRGRKPRPEERLEQRSIRLHPDDWARIERNGGLPWLRRAIRLSRVKPLQPGAAAQATA